ncbi:MAG: hypothetical protein HFK08_04330 [Clostridia bacterium]|jgi:hypothetical protein|nr:hypothetical protein [Clostridia bacterium]
MENIVERNVVAKSKAALSAPRHAAPVRKIRNASVNLVRQFPERPGEWGNRIVIVVCAGSGNGGDKS